MTHALDTQQIELDTQQVELFGRAALTAALVADGIEVARPERDAGVDLLAFTFKPWKVMPIQMKAATGAGFSVHRKCERVDRLVMVYVWNARSAHEVEFYAMSWKEAKRIADDLGWTKTQSWQGGDRYATTRPSEKVRRAIAAHKMSAGQWRGLLDNA